MITNLIKKITWENFGVPICVSDGNAVFSLNFSSAGKGPFMDGKPKNIILYFSPGGGGGGGGR